MSKEIEVEEAQEEQNVQEGQEAQEGQDVQGEQEVPQSLGKKIRGIVLEACVYVVIIVLCITVVPRYVIQRTVVDGDSMMDTLIDQDNLLVEKVSYRLKDPDRFDVIVFFPHGRDNPDYYIKRVIGLPGETVQIIGSDIYINGEVLKEDYGKDPIDKAGIVAEPQTLGEDEFFVLGDNREESLDSRYEEVGFVDRKNIEGKAILRIYPFDKFGTFE